MPNVSNFRLAGHCHSEPAHTPAWKSQGKPEIATSGYALLAMTLKRVLAKENRNLSCHFVIAFSIAMVYNVQSIRTWLSLGSEGSAASGGFSDPSEWPRSVSDAAAPSARRAPGTATGDQLQKSLEPQRVSGFSFSPYMAPTPKTDTKTNTAHFIFINASLFSAFVPVKPTNSVFLDKQVTIPFPSVLFLLPLAISFVEPKYTAIIVCSVATFSAIQEAIWVITDRGSK